jgi:hypothetical protein
MVWKTVPSRDPAAKDEMFAGWIWDKGETR